MKPIDGAPGGGAGAGNSGGAHNGPFGSSLIGLGDKDKKQADKKTEQAEKDKKAEKKTETAKV